MKDLRPITAQFNSANQGQIRFLKARRIEGELTKADQNLEVGRIGRHLDHFQKKRIKLCQSFRAKQETPDRACPIEA